MSPLQIFGLNFNLGIFRGLNRSRVIMKWTRNVDDGGHPTYTSGRYEICRMDSTARSRFVWVVYIDGEPATKTTKFGPRFIASDTLKDAKRVVARIMTKI